jgi:hypothetical protein
MALSRDQENRLACASDLIITDPEATLAARLTELGQQLDAARRPKGRLAAIAGLIHQCPPPDVLAGYDQCAHGTRPCQSTQAAWLAQGKDRDQQMRRFSQAVQREAQIYDAEREPREEYEAAQREGRRPYWGTGLAAEPGPGH